MERRTGLRGRTDFSVTARDGFRAAEVRAIELSGSGIVLDRGRFFDPERDGLVVRLELRLPERHRPITALARPVRVYGNQQALRFVEISDADRLTLAEHLDIVYRRGGELN